MNLPRSVRSAAYWLVLVATSGLVLLNFFTPGQYHKGINDYEKARFLEMVYGQAHRPFVTRSLLPVTVRLSTAIVPATWREAATRWGRESVVGTKVFERFHWDAAGAWEYLFAAGIMWLCFLAFGHLIGVFTIRIVKLRQCLRAQLCLAIGGLLGLPAMFRWSSFPYDPPQLILFLLALWLIAGGRTVLFLFVFILCTLNKETALLLIPIYAFAEHTRTASQGRTRLVVGAMVVGYALVRGWLSWVYAANPGGMVEFQLGHNVQLLTGGWTYVELTVIVALMLFVFLEWRNKPAFLRMALGWTAIPLVVFTIFLGYLDELRGYYEAYPPLFALVIHSLARFQRWTRSLRDA